MNKKIASQWLAAVVAAAIASPLLANDWTNWRGPEQSGISRETNLPDKWDPFSGENVAWRNDGVKGMSSPVVCKGKLYAWTRVGDVVYGEGANKTLVPGPATQEALACVDINTGKTLWEYKVNMSQTDVPFHRLGWGNVVVDPKGDRVYGYGVQGHLVCLDTATGKPIWYHQMLEEYGMISTFGGRTESPTIDEDQLLITGVAFGWGDHAQGQHRCFAFDKATGEMRWTSNTGGRPVDAPYGMPIITVVNGQRLVVFCAGDGGVYGFTARTGEKVFGYVLSKRGTNATPLIIGDKLIACSSEENPDNGVNGRIACLDLSSIDAKTKTIKEFWHVDQIEAGFPSPTYDGKETVFIMDNSSRVHALDLNTGKKLWNQKVGTVGKASLVYGDGKLYACDAKNFLVIQPPAPGKKRAKVVSKIELGADAQTLGREYYIFGSPAISDGRIYLETAGGTFCIGPKEIKPQNVEVPGLAAEPAADANAAPAVVQVVPCDRMMEPGEKTNFTVRTYDAQGRLLADRVKAQWTIGPVMLPPPPRRPGTPAPAIAPKPTPAGNLKGKVDENGQYSAENGPPQGGAVIATVDSHGKKVSGNTRVRVMPNLPWSFDFESSPAGAPPLTWVNAGGKFAVRELPDKNKVLVKTLNLDMFHAARTFFGDTRRADYTIDADVRVGSVMAGQRNMPDAGVVANKYGLTLMGNHQKLIINAWSGALPKEGQAGASLFASTHYTWEPDKWYHLKLSVEKNDKGALVRGKVWPTGDKEPEKWALTLEDTVPNAEGSPGLFGESLVTPIKSEIFYDNIVVSPNK